MSGIILRSMGVHPPCMLSLTLVDAAQVNRNVNSSAGASPFLDAFARHNHFNILHPILR